MSGQSSSTRFMSSGRLFFTLLTSTSQGSSLLAVQQDTRVLHSILIHGGSDQMMSFEIVESGNSKAIQIYADDEGLTALANILEKVRQTGGHLHLMSGVELAERSPYGTPAIPEVIIGKSDFIC
jgi:hypothetical protein